MKNVTSGPISLTGFQIALSGGNIHTIEQGVISAGDLIVLSAKDLGYSPEDNDRLFLFDPPCIISP